MELLANMKYDCLGREMYISLNTAGSEVQERSKKYHSIWIPTIAITLSDDCTNYAKLESIVAQMELALNKHYDFDQRKTTTEYTERKTVELAEIANAKKCA